MAELPEITMEIGEIKPQKWEYDIYYFGDIAWNKGKVLEILDSYGKDRWELVSVDAATFYFRRPVWSSD